MKIYLDVTADCVVTLEPRPGQPQKLTIKPKTMHGYADFLRYPPVIDRDAAGNLRVFSWRELPDPVLPKEPPRAEKEVA